MVSPLFQQASLAAACQLCFSGGGLDGRHYTSESHLDADAGMDTPINLSKRLPRCNATRSIK